MACLIGMTTGLRRGSKLGGKWVGVRRRYVQAILDAGGWPVLLPPAPETVLHAVLARLNGLLLTGGVDIAPAHYGEKRHPRLGRVEPERDALELPLCHWALAENRPVLGICRGIQLMNVAAGGTLYQDIPSQYQTSIVHATDLALPRGHLAHTITLEPGSRLAGIMGREPLSVNSWHHQAVKDLGRGMVVSARAPDGIIEGIEVPGHRFAVAVQFHPEDLYENDGRVRRLFTAFIAACSS